MKQAAFQATVHGFRTVPSRGVISITIECPIEHHAEIARIAEHGAWVAVARLQEPGEKPAKDKKDWRDLGPAQQAGIRCDEPTFAAFLKEQRSDDWHEAGNDPAACVRLICGVSSRAYIEKDQRSRVIWKQLDDQFQAWKALEHA